jgi:hypothetical protein
MEISPRALPRRRQQLVCGITRGHARAARGARNTARGPANATAGNSPRRGIGAALTMAHQTRQDLTTQPPRPRPSPTTTAPAGDTREAAPNTGL